jgi:hypothetical protein
MRKRQALVAFWLVTVSVLAQNPTASLQPSPKVSSQPQTAAAPQNTAPSTYAEITVGDSKLSEALGKWLEKLASEKPPDKETSWDKAFPTVVGAIVGAVISAVVSLIGVWTALKRDENREKETTRREGDLAKLRADLERDKLGFANALEKELTDLRARLEEARDAASGRRDQQLEQLSASLEIARELLKSHQQRLEKFHAPLRALFQQSRGVTDKLHYHVYRLRMEERWPNASAPDQRKYAYLTDEEVKRSRPEDVHSSVDSEYSPGSRLCVWYDERWCKFRMLDFMPWLLENPNCRALVDQIMMIGRKNTEIIRRYSGLAAAGQPPSPVFGEYLAHFAVLQTTYDAPPQQPYPPESQKIGYYPRGLDAEVEKGYTDACAAVAPFESLTTRVLEMIAAASTQTGVTPE